MLSLDWAGGSGEATTVPDANGCCEYCGAKL